MEEFCGDDVELSGFRTTGNFLIPPNHHLEIRTQQNSSAPFCANPLLSCVRDSGLRTNHDAYYI
jgi:hypothetical protein